MGDVGGEVDGSDVFPAASACSKVAIRWERADKSVEFVEAAVSFCGCMTRKVLMEGLLVDDVDDIAAKIIKCDSHNNKRAEEQNCKM